MTLLYCFAGVFIGTLVGVLPGIGPMGAMAILLPSTYGLPPAASIIMLSGIYYGAMYGGSTTSILVNIPGEAASVITCLDGYQMARAGRAGPALSIAAFGSFIGGTFSIVALQFLVFPLSDAALKFGPPEFFALMCLGMTILTYLARGTAVDAMLMVLLGLILGTVGMDPILGTPRFHFGSTSLLDGVGLVPVAMGLFGISEVLFALEREVVRDILQARLAKSLPTREDWRRSAGPIGRGSLIGFLCGIIPGGGAVMSSFLSYSIEKRLSKRPEEFGCGAIEGVAGPESANNAAAGGAFVPMLALGIPPSPIMGLLLGALMIHGVTPGPLLISQHPEIFWGVIASMYIGNAMLVLLNLPLVGIWVRVLRIPSRLLLPLILFCCLIGAYSANNNPTEVVIMVVFGVVGYVLRKLKYDMAPLIMALVLGPLIEANFRNSLIMSDGRFRIFLQWPISGPVLMFAALLLVSTTFSAYRKNKARMDSSGLSEDA
ncbi:MAG: tripartite tricarboxylate transporter permease [Deltaproteobacteria bacterium]|nr:tripartite tricarboxylate transporter permease [Deltaproteobacteria bacterium]